MYGNMVSTDLMTRGIRPPHTPVRILATDDKPETRFCVTASGLLEVRSARQQVLRAAAPKQKPRTAGGLIMIMRMTWGKLRAGTWQDFERAYNATVAGKEVKGLRGRWLAQDVNDPNGGFAVSLWDTL